MLQLISMVAAIIAATLSPPPAALDLGGGLEHTAARAQWAAVVVDVPASVAPAPPAYVDPAPAVAAAVEVRPGCPAEVVAVFAPVGEAPAACAISYCETSGTWNPAAHNDRGEDSRGLFQVNVGWSGPAGPHGWASYAGVAPDELFDPLINATVALAVWEYSGRRWSAAWVTCSALHGLD